MTSSPPLHEEVYDGNHVIVQFYVCPHRLYMTRHLHTHSHTHAHTNTHKVSRSLTRLDVAENEMRSLRAKQCFRMYMIRATVNECKIGQYQN